MDAFLDFARGPLFRVSLAVMLLGLLRILALDIFGAVEAYRKAGDKTLPWRFIVRRTLMWLVPVNRVFTRRPAYSLFSILFHVGLLLVPIFLYAHVELWRGVIGFGWWTLPKEWADWLTISTIVFALALFVGRVGSVASRFISRKQDYLWPLVLVIPFVSGYICANLNVGPATYQISMLVHILSAEVIFILLPFTKLAHCILTPLSQVISNVAWKFPAGTDDDVCTTLNKKGAPV
ncbi:MAG: respiratory nitrate reductase subunit gamma [candidate division Zixibacteria bacterium]|nr:respiratory nitrate reductase subunit gamma [candidate division Zixibacteria bacterium]